MAAQQILVLLVRVQILIGLQTEKQGGVQRHIRASTSRD